MDLFHICKIIGYFRFQQSSHSEIMTIIYLINHSTNKLFNGSDLTCDLDFVSFVIFYSERALIQLSYHASFFLVKVF